MNNSWGSKVLFYYHKSCDEIWKKEEVKHARSFHLISFSPSRFFFEGRKKTFSFKKLLGLSFCGKGTVKKEKRAGCGSPPPAPAIRSNKREETIEWEDKKVLFV